MSNKHEYLLMEDYYESRSVGTRAKSDKQCEFCGGLIPKGEPHDMHHFYPEFTAYATHKECSSKFESPDFLRTAEDKEEDEDE